MSSTDKESVNLDWLYQEIILDHYKRPRNFGTLENADVVVEEENPYCGDHIVLQLKVDDDTIADIRFSGRGCAISQASASMMTEKVKGMKLDEALKFAEEFRRMMRNEKPFPPEGEFGDLDALRGVREFPVRIKCAILAWELLQNAIAQVMGQERGKV